MIVGAGALVTTGLLAVLAAVTSALAALGVQRIRRPLAAVVAQATALTERRFVSISEPSVPELRDVARAMNSMVSRLKAMFDEQSGQVEQLRRRANCDPLTGLSNRKAIDTILNRAMDEARAGNPGPSLIIADIDLFKNINDTYGHLFGDKVIRAVAHILRQNVKGKDTAGRYGGEEFVLVLPDTPLEGAEVLAETIRHAIEHSRIRNVENNQTIGKVTLSFGVAAYQSGETASQLIERADRALYASKQNGRNRVTVSR